MTQAHLLKTDIDDQTEISNQLHVFPLDGKQYYFSISKKDLRIFQIEIRNINGKRMLHGKNQLYVRIIQMENYIYSIKIVRFTTKENLFARKDYHLLQFSEGKFDTTFYFF